jgi:hypothetical protein
MNWFDERVLTLLRHDKVGCLINFCFFKRLYSMQA